MQSQIINKVNYMQCDNEYLINFTLYLINFKLYLHIYIYVFMYILL